jgi:hypothetical protein
MAPTVRNYPTPASGCRYCGIPCPNVHCSWECARFDRQSESTWRRAETVWANARVSS